MNVEENAYHRGEADGINYVQEKYQIITDIYCSACAGGHYELLTTRTERTGVAGA